VTEVLDGDHLHLTAEAVHGRARERLPEISLATVYNTLNELVAMGEVLEISGAGGAKRYDPNARLDTTTWCAVIAESYGTSFPGVRAGSSSAPRTGMAST